MTFCETHAAKCDVEFFVNLDATDPDVANHWQELFQEAEGE